MKDFKIICNNCDKEIIIKEIVYNKDINKQGLDIFNTTYAAILIRCNCGNKVWVR